MTPIHLFTQYQLTEEEESSGSILSEHQLAVLNNDLVEALNNRLALRLDTANPLQFAQEEAEWSGRIVYIRAVIDRHNMALQNLADQIQSNKEQ